MTSNDVLKQCLCLSLQGKPEEADNLQLLSQIPNQSIYRCMKCHSFLAYSENTQSWEVLLQADLETELKTLYQSDTFQNRELG
ncbi:MAG: hypothetical protein CSA61_02370 [Neptuniibacter caesariensis]|uniref:Uncharacterized protein n=1 Tax=Neptuniibacter caesariensis TaxID=207954 RepID=A0A2G6JD35_NEPCE|nr:MAG: hypothetical protein CSA61_02370 [Neptuniibacter caesariensis]